MNKKLLITCLVSAAAFSSLAQTTRSLSVVTNAIAARSFGIAPSNYRVFFSPGAQVAGLNVGLVFGDPSDAVNGDIWYNYDAGELRAMVNGVTVSLGGGGSQTPWTSNINAAGYTLSNVSEITALESANGLDFNFLLPFNAGEECSVGNSSSRFGSGYFNNIYTTFVTNNGTYIGNNTITLITNGTANTRAPGIILTNATVASSGNQMYSPTIRLIGNGWKTTATAASQPMLFDLVNEPVQGAANPTANFKIYAATNTGTPATVLTVSSAGDVTSAGSITSGSTINALTRLNITSKLGIASFLDGEPTMYNSVDSQIAKLRYNYQHTTKTTNYTLIATDSGGFYNNIGAAGSITFTLPTPAVGQWFAFQVEAAQTIVIDAAGTDVIRHVADVTSAGGTVTSAAQYSFIEIYCVSAGQWRVRIREGSWTFA